MFDPSLIKKSIVESVGFRQTEDWTIVQVRFAEQARDAARHALWFLRLVEKDSDDELVAFAAKNARRSLMAVAPPGAASTDDEEASGESYSGAVEQYFATLLANWNNVLQALTPGAGAITRATIEAQEEALEAFIRGSRPYNRWLRFTYATLPALKLVARQHSAIILALLLAAGVCVAVAPVRNLLLNDLQIGALVICAIASPAAFLRLAQSVTDRRGRAAPWEIGARVVHDLPASAKPQPWVPWHPPAYERTIYRSLGLKALLYVAIWIALGLMMLLAVAVGNFDGIWMTTYEIVAVCGFIVLLGGLIDFADMHSRAPLRGIMVLGVAIVAGVIYVSDSTGAFVIALLLWGAGAGYWAWQVKIPTTIIRVPAVIVLMVAGGYLLSERRRAKDLESLITVPAAASSAIAWPKGTRLDGPIVVMAASGGGSRAAIFAAQTLTALDTAYPAVARRLQAISSVSGGSLANAGYVARRLGVDAPDSSCTRPLVEAVSGDFLRPVLKGVVWGGRAAGIERAWESCPVGLGKLDIGTIADRWNATNGLPPFPLPIFNSVSLERNAVVISPLPQDFFSMDFDEEARSHRNKYIRAVAPTWVHYRSGIYHISDLLPSSNARLSAAVRASANFPFGFPLVEIETDMPLFYGLSMNRWSTYARADSVRNWVRLTDGGALSNSGMWSLTPLLLNRRDHIDTGRGVLLIVVDASRMPGAPSIDRQRGLLETISDKHPKGDRVHGLMLDQLQAVFGECFAYVHIGLPADERYNVYTTWALDRASMARVDTAFAMAWRTAGREIAEQYQRLQKCDRRNPYRRPSVRHPID